MPSTWRPGETLPLVVALHGGAGNKEASENATCEDGNTGHPTCLLSAAERQNFLVALANGTARAGEVRTWNAGAIRDVASHHRGRDLMER